MHLAKACIQPLTLDWLPLAAPNRNPRRTSVPGPVVFGNNSSCAIASNPVVTSTYKETKRWLYDSFLSSHGHAMPSPTPCT